jgi:outer membrane protein assembly factor BamB
MYRADSREDRSILVAAFNGKVFGLDRASGVPRWAVNVEEHGGEVELAVDADVVVACTHTRLTFIRYATGEILRLVELVGEYPSRPLMLIDGGQILIARHGEVSCYALSGDALWLQPFTGHGFGSVALGLPGQVRQADDTGAK